MITALSSPFFQTLEQRTAFARERFFDGGQTPSGLVAEPLLQSWSRCLRAHRVPDEALAFDPISKTRLSTTLTRNRALLESARESMAELETSIAGSGVTAMLTNHEGVVIHATAPTQTGAILPLVARVGVSIGELSVGTGAPGVAARTGQVAVVRGGEHFFRCMGSLHCSAAPIRDASGCVVATLDLSSEHPFRFDAATLAGLYATSIENRLLASSAREHVLVRYQLSANLLRTPLEGLAAIDGTGRVLWLNGTGARLLGHERVPALQSEAGEVFGLDVEDLLAMARHGTAQQMRLPAGLTLWIETKFSHGERSGDGVPEVPDTGDGMDVHNAAPAAADGDMVRMLKDVNRQVIESTLEQCRGNLSKAARTLGVSRNLLYRRIREWSAP
nr:transcriptional activator of acetoin/glycerol metabolism [uncultured bacterium]